METLFVHILLSCVDVYVRALRGMVPGKRTPVRSVHWGACVFLRVATAPLDLE